MIDPEESQRWNELAADLGLPVDEEGPAEAEAAEQPMEEEVAEEEAHAPEEVTEEAPAAPEWSEEADLEPSELPSLAEAPEAAEAEAEGRGRKRRRRSRKPREGKEQAAVSSQEEMPTEESLEVEEAGATFPPEPGEEAEPGTEAPRRRRRRRRKGSPPERGAAPAREEAEEAPEEIEPAIEPESSDEGDDEDEDLSTWNIPSWNDLIASLYRPER